MTLWAEITESIPAAELDEVRKHSSQRVTNRSDILTLSLIIGQEATGSWNY